MTNLVAFSLSYLVNSLWQVPLLWAAGCAAAYVLRRSSPLRLHRIWVTVLVAEAVLPGLSAVAPAWQPVWSRWMQHVGTGAGSRVTVTVGPGSVLDALHVPAGWLLSLEALYAAALLFCVARFVMGWLTTRKLGAVAELPPFEHDAEVRALWAECTHLFRTPRATLAVSGQVRTPLTVGWSEPKVLLPPGLLQRLSTEELRALFAHECSHIQRGDFAWNVLYELLALPVAYHPALRLTRRRLVESREWACDAMAAGTLRAPVPYARSLVRLATMLLHAMPAAAPHAIGMLDANALERRVMHLTRRSTTPTLFRRSAAALACTGIALGTCASAWALRTGLHTPMLQQAAASVPKIVRISGGVMAGNSETKVPPMYPSEAKAAGIQGAVVLHAIINKEGAVEQLEVMSGPEELRDSALEAVKQWTYKPYELNGQPTAVETTITVNYQLAP